MVQSDVSLMEEIIKQKLEELQRDLDADVVRLALVETGWVEVEFHYKNREHAVDVQEWCELNIKKSHWMRCGSHYVFKNKPDAGWFMLRWL